MRIFILFFLLINSFIIFPAFAEEDDDFDMDIDLTQIKDPELLRAKEDYLNLKSQGQSLQLQKGLYKKMRKSGKKIVKNHRSMLAQKYGFKKEMETFQMDKNCMENPNNPNCDGFFNDLENELNNQENLPIQNEVARYNDYQMAPQAPRNRPYTNIRELLSKDNRPQIIDERVEGPSNYSVSELSNQNDTQFGTGIVVDDEYRNNNQGEYTQYAREVGREISNHSQQFKGCYKRREQEVSGLIKAMIKIAPNGEIDHIHFPNVTNFNNDKVLSCVASVLHKLNFKNTPGRKQVTLLQPFYFNLKN